MKKSEAGGTSLALMRDEVCWIDWEFGGCQVKEGCPLGSSIYRLVGQRMRMQEDQTKTAQAGTRNRQGHHLTLERLSERKEKKN